MRLIDADAPVRKMDDYVTAHNALIDIERVDGVLIAKSFIDEQPTVDAVRVVRCGECKHYGTAECDMEYYGNHMPEDWYCADGERREDDN